MSQTSTRLKAPEGIDEIWNQVREHHGDVAGLKTGLSSLGATVGQLSAKVDAVLEAVTQHSARQGPGLMQIMSGLGLLLAIVGGLSTGIAIFVGNMYGGELASLKGDLSAARVTIAARESEDRTELARLRDVERAAVADRIKRLEEQASWAPTEIRPEPSARK